MLPKFLRDFVEKLADLLSGRVSEPWNRAKILIALNRLAGLYDARKECS
jgi:hypothetical protein